MLWISPCQRPLVWFPFAQISTYWVQLVKGLGNVLAQAVLTVLEGRREEADEVEVDVSLNTL
jgi:hypothetical protein